MRSRQFPFVLTSSMMFVLSIFGFASVNRGFAGDLPTPESCGRYADAEYYTVFNQQMNALKNKYDNMWMISAQTFCNELDEGSGDQFIVEFDFSEQGAREACYNFAIDRIEKYAQSRRERIYNDCMTRDHRDYDPYFNNNSPAASDFVASAGDGEGNAVSQGDNRSVMGSHAGTGISIQSDCNGEDKTFCNVRPGHAEINPQEVQDANAGQVQVAE